MREWPNTLLFGLVTLTPYPETCCAFATVSGVRTTIVASLMPQNRNTFWSSVYKDLSKDECYDEISNRPDMIPPMSNRIADLRNALDNDDLKQRYAREETEKAKLRSCVLAFRRCSYIKLTALSAQGSTQVRKWSIADLATPGPARSPLTPLSQNTVRNGPTPPQSQLSKKSLAPSQTPTKPLSKQSSKSLAKAISKQSSGRAESKVQPLSRGSPANEAKQGLDSRQPIEILSTPPASPLLPSTYTQHFTTPTSSFEGAITARPTATTALSGLAVKRVPKVGPSVAVTHVYGADEQPMGLWGKIPDVKTENTADADDTRSDENTEDSDDPDSMNELMQPVGSLVTRRDTSQVSDPLFANICKILFDNLANIYAPNENSTVQQAVRLLERFGVGQVWTWVQHIWTPELCVVRDQRRWTDRQSLLAISPPLAVTTGRLRWYADVVTDTTSDPYLKMYIGSAIVLLDCMHNHVRELAVLNNRSTLHYYIAT